MEQQSPGGRRVLGLVELLLGELLSQHCVLGQKQPTPQNSKSFITPALGLGMGICEWGKVEFFNFSLPWLAIFSLKVPE